MEIIKRVKREIALYRLVMQDKRTPRLSKWLLGLAIGYALSPVDLIPDFIPVVGHLDDLMIVPGLCAIALKLIPGEVVAECRQKLHEHAT